MALYESFSTGDNGAQNCHGANWLAQTFTVQASHTIDQVSLKVYRGGATGLPGEVTVAIKAVDGNGHPTGDDLASGTIDADEEFTTSSDGEWEDITLTNTGSLIAAIKYAIILKALDGNSSNSVYWRVNSVGDYDDGNFMYSADSGDSWTDRTWDAMFKEYGAGLYAEGTKTITGLGYAGLPVEELAGSWPDEKPDIDPDLEWDEATQTWVSIDNSGGGRYKEQLIAIGRMDAGTGCIYFGSA